MHARTIINTLTRVQCSVKKWLSQDSQWYNHSTATGAHIGRNAEGVAVSALAGLGMDNILASGSARGSIKLWDSNTTTALEEQQAHADYIHALYCNQNRLFSASADRTVKVADTHLLIYVLTF